MRFIDSYRRVFIDLNVCSVMQVIITYSVLTLVFFNVTRESVLEEDDSQCMLICYFFVFTFCCLLGIKCQPAQMTVGSVSAINKCLVK